MQAISNTLATQIDGDAHRALLAAHLNKDGVPRLGDDPTYDALHRVLAVGAAANHLDSPLYTLVREGDAWSFGVTSAKEPYFRHEYHPPSMLRNQYEQGGMIQTYTDANGTWLSAFAPVLATDGRVVAIVQADQRFEQFQTEAQWNALRRLLVLGGVLGAMGAVVVRFVGRSAASLSAAHRLLADRHLELTTAYGDLERAQGRLVEAQKMAALGQMVAGVAHELNTPLGIAVTAASQMKNDLALVSKGDLDPDERQEALDALGDASGLILSNLGRSAELVKRFKQLAIEDVVPTASAVRVADELAQTVGALRPLLLEGKVSVSVACPPNLVVKTFPGPLAQVVTNLLSNTVQHAFADKGGTVQLAASLDGDTLVLVCTDDGAGMSEEVRARVFDPFFTTRRGKGGMGLGLHLVHNLVTQVFGGTITCTSGVGRGASFVVRFPVRGAAG